MVPQDRDGGAREEESSVSLRIPWLQDSRIHYHFQLCLGVPPLTFCGHWADQSASVSELVMLPGGRTQPTFEPHYNPLLTAQC